MARAAEEEEQQQPEVEAEEAPEQAIAAEEFEFSLSEAKKVIGNAGMGLEQVVNVDQQRGSSSRQQRARGAIGAADGTVRCTIIDLDAFSRNWSIGRGCWQAAWGISAVCCFQWWTAGHSRIASPAQAAGSLQGLHTLLCVAQLVMTRWPAVQHPRVCAVAAMGPQPRWQWQGETCTRPHPHTHQAA